MAGFNHSLRKAPCSKARVNDDAVSLMCVSSEEALKECLRFLLLAKGSLGDRLLNLVQHRFELILLERCLYDRVEWEFKAELLFKLHVNKGISLLAVLPEPKDHAVTVARFLYETMSSETSGCLHPNQWIGPRNPAFCAECIVQVTVHLNSSEHKNDPSIQHALDYVVREGIEMILTPAGVGVSCVREDTPRRVR